MLASRAVRSSSTRCVSSRRSTSRPARVVVSRPYSTPSDAPKLPAFDHKPQPYTGPTIEQVKELRSKYLNPALFLLYKQPVMIVEGKMQYMYDEKGKRYLDAFAGIVTVSVGHSHPKVNAAAKAQIDKIMHTTTIYLNPEISLYAKELADRMPGNLKNVYFVNSGSEANDLAMLLARLYTNSEPIICLRNGYHGMSQGTMGLTALNTWKYPVAQGYGLLHALNPDTYRGPFSKDVANVGEKSASLL